MDLDASGWPEDVRPIRAADAKLPFRTREDRLNRPLTDYVELGKAKDSLVVIRERDGQIVALAWLIVEREHLVIEVLARDQVNGKGSGAYMLAFVEDYIAHAVGRREIRLEALNDALRNWYGAQGYLPHGEPYDDPEWGRLYPMRKRLT